MDKSFKESTSFVSETIILTPDPFSLSLNVKLSVLQSGDLHRLLMSAPRRADRRYEGPGELGSAKRAESSFSMQQCTY